MIPHSDAQQSDDNGAGAAADHADLLRRPAHSVADALTLCDALIHELAPDPLFDDARDLEAVRQIRAVLAAHAK